MLHFPSRISLTLLNIGRLLTSPVAHKPFSLGQIVTEMLHGGEIAGSHDLLVTIDFFFLAVP